MSKNNYSSSREENFKNARNDYGQGHRFNSRGLAPSFLGADSIPQAVSDTHWSMHGLAKRIDDVEGEIVTIDNTQKDNVYSSEEIFDKVGELIVGGSQSLSNYTGYFTKVLTTRPRIFSDSFTCESYMAANDRLRGFTSDYQWISYNADSINCEGALDKIIDYTYCTDHHDKDNKNAKFIFKGRITLPQLGTLKRVFITQKDNNLIIRYLLTNTISDGGIIGYTGSIIKEEYDYTGTRVRKSHESLAHTPLMLLGAFSIDPNDNKDYIQYISTDYKLIQHFDDEDLILGQLPTDVIDMIDPVNDLVSDSKVAYIMTYDDKGHLKFPLKGFTLTNSLQQSTYKAEDTTPDDTTDDTIPPFEDGEEYLKVSDMFTITILENSNSSTIMDKIISITPRVDSHRLTKGNPDGQVWSEGGFYAEVYDNEEQDTDHYYPAASHIFYMADRLSWPDADWFANTMFDYYTVKPSDYSFYRERDYLEFPSITFSTNISSMFPEVSNDFGIGNTTPFTIKFNESKTSIELKVHLAEPFIIERSLGVNGEVEVNSRLGYTVTQNSDSVSDVSSTNILAVYRKLDFILPLSKELHKYVSLQPNYNKDAYVHRFVRYQVINPMPNETTSISNIDGMSSVTRLTYFDSKGSQTISLDSASGSFINNSNFDEQFGDSVGVPLFSPGSSSNYLYNLTNSRFVFTSETKYKDLPYMYTSDKAYGGSLTHNFLLTNKQDSKGITQILNVTETNADGLVSSVRFSRTVHKEGNNVIKVSSWSGKGQVSLVTINTVKDVYQVLNTTGIYYLNEVITPTTSFPNTSPSTGSNNIGKWVSSYVKSAQPLHAIFANAADVRFEVYNAKDDYRHIVLTVTDRVGKSMAYHNISLSSGKDAYRVNLDSLVDNTSGSYTYALAKWLPGEYVGDKENPLPPDSSAESKLVWKWIAMLDARQTATEDTYSIHVQQDGSWKRPNFDVEDNQGLTYDESTGKWSSPNDIQTYSASTFISNSTVPYTINDNFLGASTLTINNGTQVNPDGLWSPNTLDLIGKVQQNLNYTENKLDELGDSLTTYITEVDKRLTAVEKVMSSLIKSLTDSGAWDPNATPSSAAIKGSIKSGVNLAYGNINLFGGTQDGGSYIRTSSTGKENDLVGGI